MITENFNIQQDTLQHKSIERQDTVHVISNQQPARISHVAPPPVNTDTTSVCSRNSIVDVTFYDINNFILKMGYGSYKPFPYTLIEKTRKQHAEERIFLLKHLKQGIILPAQPLHADWIILIIMIATALFAIVKNSSGKMTSSVSKYFMLRGNETVSRDLGGLFYWQSTLLNLVSFLVISLFGYSAGAYYGAIPSGIKGILMWGAILLIISMAVTLRHFTCVITGAASGRQEVFREYLVSIYQAYRFAALFLFFIVILITYTSFLPVNTLIISGLIIIGLVYLFRVIRLLIIFLNRNISIFYLILYLCALEILPVLVVAKFFTGLV